MASTTTTLNDLLPQIVAEAMFVASERSIMRGLVKNYQLSQGQGKTVTVPIFPRQTATTLTEGNEISDTNASTDSNVVADLGRLFGEAIARKIDTDLTALFPSFAAGYGNYTAVITAQDIFKSVATLKADGVPTEGMVCVLHPEIAYDLKAALTTAGNTPFTMGAYGENANEAMRMGYVGQLAGIPVYETSNITNVTNPGDFPGAVFQLDGLGLAMIGDIGIETQRRASYLGTDVVGYCHYGTGIIYNAYGRHLKFDSSIT